MYTLVTMRHALRPPTGWLAVRCAVLGAGLALGAACGGGGGGAPAAPTGAAALPAPTPAPVALAPEVRNGETGALVAAVASPAQVVPGAPVGVAATGFLRRQQFFVGGAPIFLWPQEEAYVRAVVYAGGYPGGPYGLVRWSGGFRVKPWPGTEDKMAVVLAEASRVSGLPITMTTTGPAEVEFILDPSEPALVDLTALAVTFRTYSGLTITRSRVVFRSLGEFLGNNLKNGGRTNIPLHETGHVLGLDHSISYHDVMSIEDNTNPGPSYGPSEELALRMMYAYRAAGNAFPDRAPGVPTATALRAPPAVIVD